MKRTSFHRMMRVGAAALAIGLCAIGHGASAEDTVRSGIQIGALGALRTTLPEIQAKHGLKYDIKDFRDSTEALRALDQGELEIANTTAQHLVRAIEEGINVVWVAGWGGGYNVLVAGKDFALPAADDAAVKAAILKRKASAPVKIGVPTGSMQHARLLQYLRAIGVDANKDVTVVNIPFPAHPQALQGGEVDMDMTLAGFGVLAMEKSGAKLVKHLFGGPYGKQEIGFIVQRSLIEKKPDLVARIVASHVEAMNMFSGDMAKQVMYEKKYSRFPPTVIETAEQKFLRYDYRTNVADLKTNGILIVNTDNEYTYLGRLVVEFDADGNIVTDLLDDYVAINGAYASTEDTLEEVYGDDIGDAFADGSKGDQVRDITEAVNDVIAVKEAMLTSNERGIQNFDSALLHLYKEGRIDMEEALANADSRTNLEARINFG